MLVFNVCLTEHMPGVQPQLLSQTPQARGQRKGPLEGPPPPHQAIPYEAWMSTPPSPQPPPPGVQGPRGQPQPPSFQPPPPGVPGPWGQAQPPLSSQPPPPAVQGPWPQPQHLVRPAGPAPERSVAPGAVGPSGWTPPLSQAQSSSPAPSGKIEGNEGEIKHLLLKCLYNHSYLEFCAALIYF